MSLQDALNSGFNETIAAISASKAKREDEDVAKARAMTEALARNRDKLELLRKITFWMIAFGLAEKRDPSSKRPYRTGAFQFAEEPIGTGKVVLDIDAYGDWSAGTLYRSARSRNAVFSLTDIRALIALDQMNIKTIVTGLGRIAALNEKPKPIIDL